MKNTDKKEDDNAELHQEIPSFYQMAKNFTKSLTEHVANGMKSVSLQIYMERLDACNKCEHLIKNKKRCGLCGCMLEHKAKWETATCPDKISRWENGGPTNGSDEEVDYPRTGGLSRDTGPRN